MAVGVSQCLNALASYSRLNGPVGKLKVSWPVTLMQAL